MDNGKRLRELMSKGQWSPQKVADILGLSRNTIYAWLTDDSRIPSYALMMLETMLEIRRLKEKIRAMKLSGGSGT